MVVIIAVDSKRITVFSKETGMLRLLPHEFSQFYVCPPKTTAPLLTHLNAQQQAVVKLIFFLAEKYSRPPTIAELTSSVLVAPDTFALLQVNGMINMLHGSHQPEDTAVRVQLIPTPRCVIWHMQNR